MKSAMRKYLRQGPRTGAGPSRSITFGKNARDRPVPNGIPKITTDGKVVSLLSMFLVGPELP